jgi:protoporphyrinogen oxidase
MADTNTSGVVVLGAGLAGLGFAQSLPGARLFEAQPHPGGHAYSYPIGGVCFDQGAHISHTKQQEFLDLIYRHAGQVHQIEPSIVQNYWCGWWLTYPVQNHLHELPLEHRIPALTDLVMAHINPRGQAPANYADWCLAQYGRHLTESFYRVFTEKYWRTRMEDLATDWLGGRLLPSVVENIVRGAFVEQVWKQASFTRFHYPMRGGFFGFFESMYRQIDVRCNERAVEIDLARRVVHFASGRKEPYDVLVNSIPLPDFVKAVKDAPASVCEAAGRLRHTKLVCVNLIVRRQALARHHWCYVYDHEVGPARISVPSNLSPAGAPAGTSAFQAEIFRRGDEPWDVDTLTAETVKHMAALYGFDAQRDVVSATPVVVPYAYVISDLHRKPAVEHILAWLGEKRVFGMGLYGKWMYVWSDVAFASGEETAKQVKEYLCQK